VPGIVDWIVEGRAGVGAVAAHQRHTLLVWGRLGKRDAHQDGDNEDVCTPRATGHHYAPLAGGADCLSRHLARRR
jgi:hypothetical protein